MSDAATSDTKHRWVPAIVVALLAAFFLQGVLSMRLMSATSDEPIHLAAGYTYVATGDFRMNPEHPPLIKELSGLPLLLLRPTLDLSDPNWRADPPRQLPFGVRFLYHVNDANSLLFWGRLPVLLLGVLLGFYVFRWSRDLFGVESGLAALFLFSFSPNVIAHARLVTMDLGLACFTLIAAYHAWAWSRRGRRRRDLVLGGVALGCALGAKFSAVTLLPSIALAVAVVAWRNPSGGGAGWPGPLAGRLRGAAIALVAMFAVAAACVWAIYFFPADPTVYIDGIRKVNANHDATYYFYMFGQFVQGGWWYYPLVTFLFKTPLPLMVAVVFAFAWIRRFPAPDPVDDLFLLLPAVLLTGATCALADNLGNRYLLPVYPLLFVFVSRLAGVVRIGRAPAAAVLLLGLWYAGSALWIYPDYLSYFNELAGGPARGHRILDDSNVDWGQDLKRLPDYMERHGIERVRLLYRWNANPAYYGISWEPVSEEDWRVKPRPGTYAISTQWLIRGRLSRELHGYNSDWLDRYEPSGRIGYGIYIFEFDE